MRVLSVRQPWAHAILALGKAVENREWLRSPGLVAQAKALVGKQFLLHASDGVGTRADFDGDVDAVLDIVNPPTGVGPGQRHHVAHAMAEVRIGGRGMHHAEGWWVPAPCLVRGAIVGRAFLVNVVYTTAGGHRIPEDRRRPMRPEPCLLCGQPCTSDPRGAPCPKADPWANPGTIGLLLAEVERITSPIPLKGSLGFFEVDDGILSGAAFEAVGADR